MKKKNTVNWVVLTLILCNAGFKVILNRGFVRILEIYFYLKMDSILYNYFLPPLIPNYLKVI